MGAINGILMGVYAVVKVTKTQLDITNDEMRAKRSALSQQVTTRHQ